LVYPCFVFFSLNLFSCPHHKWRKYDKKDICLGDLLYQRLQGEASKKRSPSQPRLKGRFKNGQKNTCASPCLVFHKAPILNLSLQFFLNTNENKSSSVNVFTLRAISVFLNLNARASGVKELKKQKSWRDLTFTNDQG